MDWEDNSDSKDNIEMTDDNENVLAIDTFIKLIKVAQNPNNFEIYKLLFLRDPLFSSKQKRRHVQHQCKLASSIHKYQPLKTRF